MTDGLFNYVCRYTARRRVILVMLILNSSSVPAESKKFQVEYVRRDVSATGHKRGALLGSIYLVSQNIRIITQATPFDTYTGSLIMSSQRITITPDPGCRIYNGDNSIGLLRYNGTATETVCDPEKPYYGFIPGLTAKYTGESEYYAATGRWYVYNLPVPRMKLADVVVNDPVQALSHAGQSVVINAFMTSPSSLSVSMVQLLHIQNQHQLSGHVSAKLLRRCFSRSRIPQTLS